MDAILQHVLARAFHNFWCRLHTCLECSPGTTLATKKCRLVHECSPEHAASLIAWHVQILQELHHIGPIRINSHRHSETTPLNQPPPNSTGLSFSFSLLTVSECALFNTLFLWRRGRSHAVQYLANMVGDPRSHECVGRTSQRGRCEWVLCIDAESAHKFLHSFTKISQQLKSPLLAVPLSSGNVMETRPKVSLWLAQENNLVLLTLIMWYLDARIVDVAYTWRMVSTRVICVDNLSASDLNPIRHLWELLERNLHAGPTRPADERQLFSVLQEDWKRILPAVYQNLKKKAYPETSTALHFISKCVFTSKECLQKEVAHIPSVEKKNVALRLVEDHVTAGRTTDGCDGVLRVQPYYVARGPREIVGAAALYRVRGNVAYKWTDRTMQFEAVILCVRAPGPRVLFKKNQIASELPLCRLCRRRCAPYTVYTHLNGHVSYAYELFKILRNSLRGCPRFVASDEADIVTAFKEVAHIDGSRAADGISRLPHHWRRTLTTSESTLKDVKQLVHPLPVIAVFSVVKQRLLVLVRGPERVDQVEERQRHQHRTCRPEIQSVIVKRRNEIAPGKREIPEKTRRPAASSGTIPSCENPGVEPEAPWDMYRCHPAACPRPCLSQLSVSSAHLSRGQWRPLPAPTLDYLLPTKANRVKIPSGVARGDRAGRCRWSAGFLGDLPFPSTIHFGAAPYVASSLSALKTTMLGNTTYMRLWCAAKSTEKTIADYLRNWLGFLTAIFPVPDPHKLERESSLQSLCLCEHLNGLYPVPEVSLGTKQTASRTKPAENHSK
ncbi:hypothetical protein PR048_029178 [Dryococelus australis]|uniref:Uncharacterized protein n=1 Tax=Dryococelus australis TaxID=614101 RepID=A0ABQ9GCL6_9NEOP|nr:hypothetical protein PR048_029178 [Dryococelus australis]